MVRKSLRALIITMFIGSVWCELSYAVPASPIEHVLQQSDGTRITARQWGDEWLHGWETLDGYSITFDDRTNNWTYAVHSEDGRLTSSRNLVGKDMPPADVPKHIRPRIDEQTAVSAMQSVSASVVSPKGTANIPVMLVNFSDTATTYTAANFDTLLFGTGNKSMKDYYTEVSYGAFTVSAGPGGVVGWYKASNTHNYYGSNKSGRGTDAHPAALVIETIKAADAAGFNFAPYDQDGDCYVDVVNIVHQGTGEESASATTDIWSHRWNLKSAKAAGDGTGVYTTKSTAACGNIKVNDYVIQPEAMSGAQQTMGVFAHEYGHALGLPDLYDTDDTSEGVGEWSLMAAGSWNFTALPGDTPAHLDAWCKYKLGWLAPTQVTSTLTAEQITQASQAADTYKLLSGSPSGGGEYFLVENRQKSGFDAGLPAGGLLVWHIDESQATNNKECYPGSCASGHYHVALIQADNCWELEKKINRGNAGDTYPGSTNNKSLTGSSSPNSNLYSGTASNVSITDISASGPTMTATLSVGATCFVDSCSPLTHSFTNIQNTNTYPGGTLVYDSVETNPNDASYSYTVHPYHIFPDGSTGEGKVYSVTISAGETRTLHHEDMVPMSAVAGNYTLGVRLIDANGNEIDHDSFNFTVIGGTAVAP